MCYNTDSSKRNDAQHSTQVNIYQVLQCDKITTAMRLKTMHKKIILDINRLMCYNKGIVKGTATANPIGQGQSDRLKNSQSRTKGLTATPIIL